MANKGKEFEGDVKVSAKNQGLWILRLNDTSLSWQKEKTARFTPNNIADFLIYRYPYLFVIECKSTKYKSIGIQRDPEEDEKMIKAQQIQNLINCSTVEGIYSGFMLNYRDDNNLNNSNTYWMPIQNFSDFLVNNDKKSINAVDVVEYGCVKVDQILRRTHFTYDINKMLDDIIDFHKKGETEDG